MKRYNPLISIVIPTLNSSRTLELCLKSIKNQNYKNLEIVIADGGSVDKTLQIAKKYKTKVVLNKLKTGEAGKAVGAKKAKGEIIAFIDSDNVLPTKDWINKIIKPFEKDKDIIASEPLYFTYRRSDIWLTRYFALLGMGDPLTLFIGNYDKYSYITNDWTKLKIKCKESINDIILSLKNNIPTIGANGFFIKKAALKKYPIKDYLFDIDVLKFLSQKNEIKVAKVKVGIVHLFSGNVSTFLRKQRRRIKDYLYFKKAGVRADDEKLVILWGVTKFVFSTIFIIPILIQALVGYNRKKDFAWIFHPVACWITLLAYSTETIKSAIFKVQQYDRKKWSQ